jgi:hypothetical protein
VPRIVNSSREDTGELLDIAGAAALLLTTARGIRGRIARRQIPFRRMGRKVYFVKKELETFVHELSGCSLVEAKKNVERDPR